MESIKQILIGFSAAAIFIGSLSVLFPTGSIRKTVKYAVSLLFLCICVALFCAALKIEINVDLPDTKTLSANALVSANVQAEYLCKILLDENSITYKKVAVNTNIDKNNNIYINSITVYTDYNESAVLDVLKKVVDEKRVRVVYD